MSLCMHDLDFVQWIGLALPVFEGWNGVWAAEGKPPVDPEVLPNASKLAKSGFVLAFCVAGGDARMQFREANKQKKKKQIKHNERNKWMKQY